MTRFFVPSKPSTISLLSNDITPYSISSGEFLYPLRYKQNEIEAGLIQIPNFNQTFNELKSPFVRVSASIL